MAAPMSTDAEKNIFTFKDIKCPPDPVHAYPENLLQDNVPLIIDNGSYHCRVGWATDDQPRMTFKNVIAKQRNKKAESELQIGNDINNIDVVRWLLKSQFDRNVVTQYDVQEQIFDHIFSHLDITSQGCVDHPIVLTEPIANSNYCRQQMSELLFECYHVPKVMYGVDALYSLYNNYENIDAMNCLIVSTGYHTVHVLPFLQGKLDPYHCRRINIGGADIDGYMQRLLQLKYPAHLSHLTLTRMEECVREHCYLAEDYISDLNNWATLQYYEDNVHKIQLPFTQLAGSVISAQQQKEKKDQQIKRMKEINARKREEKMALEEKQLQQLLSIQGMQEEYKDTFKKALAELEIADAEELEQTIAMLSTSIQRLKCRLSGTEITEEIESKTPVFDLLEVPDDDLNDDQREIKNKQRIQKCAYEGRMRAKEQRELKKKKEEEDNRVMQQKKDQDFKGWLNDLNKRRGDLIKARTRRKQKRQDMSKRRTYASQQRMKILTQLAKGSKKDDNFGQNEDDWDIYKEINLQDSDSDSEAEQEKIDELENLLRLHDPDFEKESKDGNDLVYDIAEYYRLHLAVERIRVPELLFQPSLMGFDQGGIVETIDHVLSKYPANTQNTLVQNIFLTGSSTTFPNFVPRMEKELLAIRPFHSSFKINQAANPSLDSWYGAKKFTASPDFLNSCITKADYEEKGGEYLKEHLTSNRYLPTTKPLITSPTTTAPPQLPVAMETTPPAVAEA